MQNNWKTSILISFLVWGAGAQARLNDKIDTAPKLAENGASTFLSSADQEIEPEQWRVFRKAAKLHVLRPVNGIPNENVGNMGSLNLPAATQISVLSVDINSLTAQIGVENIAEENPGIIPDAPAIATVSLSELAGTSVVDTASVELYGSQEDVLAELGLNSEYAPTEEARRSGGGHARRRGGRTPGMTYCLSDVYFAAHRCSASVPKVPYAAAAYGPYVSHGWHPIGYSPSNPNCTVCIFGGGRKQRGVLLGHAAIKIGPNAWKGVGVRPTPFIPGKGANGGTERYLIGCVTPP